MLPEEVNSRHLRLGENRREDMTTELRQGAQIVTDFLHACLNNQAQHNQPYKVNNNILFLNYHFLLANEYAQHRKLFWHFSHLACQHRVVRKVQLFYELVHT